MPSFGGWEIISMPAFPDAPKTIEWSYADNIAAVRSPFSWQQQISDWGTSMLRASLTYQPLDPPDAKPWEAFLMALRGSRNIFQFGDPLNRGPQNPGATAGAVNGGGQTGFSLVTSSSGLLAGDWIQLGLRLYRVTGVSGGTLALWPNLRESPAHTTPLTITNTKGLFRLVKNDRGYRIADTKEYFFAFEIEEAL